MHDTIDDTAPARRGARINPGALLRGLGAAATVLAAVVFMLQGFDGIALALRNWFYVGFTAALAGGGLASLYLLRDRRGARLFFALAAAMAPVQAAQLGGMLYELSVGGHSPVPAMFQAGVVAPGQILPVALASVLVLLPSAYMGFKILLREHCTRLTVYYAAAGVLLLLPVRDSLWSLVVLGVLAAGLLLIEHYVFARSVVSRTWEGLTVRVMFAVPLLIAAVRAAFYLDPITVVIGVLAGGGGLALWLARAATATWFAETCRALGTLCLSLAWLLGALVFVFPVWDAYTAFFLALPAAALVLVIGHYAPGGGAGYRCVALALVALGSFGVASDSGDFTAWVLALGAGVSMSALGARYRERLVLFGGAGQAAVALVGVAVLALETMAVNTWLILALGGVALVLLSSVAERFGPRLRLVLCHWGREQTRN